MTDIVDTRHWGVRAALAPKDITTFVLREYIAPLSTGEKTLVVGTMMCSLVSAFGVQSHLAAAYLPIVGWIGAGALEVLYLSAAVAGSSARHRASWQRFGIVAVLALAAFITIIFNVAHQIEQRGYQPGFPFVVLLTEAIAFPLLAVLAATVSHGIAGARLQAEQEAQAAAELRRLQIEEADRQRQIDEDRRLRDLQFQYREQRAILELEHERKAHDIQLRAARRGVNKGVNVDTFGVNQDGNGYVNDAVNGRIVNNDAPHSNAEKHAATKTHLQQLLQSGTPVNKTAIAQQFGVSRPTVYKLLKEIKQEGGSE